MQNLKLKFYRSDEGDIPSYGTRFNRLLDDLVGGPEQWDTSSSHGVATIPATTATVERYETGPEIDAVLPLATAIITALTPIVVAWLESDRRKKEERRFIRVDACGKSIEVSGYRDADIKQLIDVVKSNC